MCRRSSRVPRRISRCLSGGQQSFTRVLSCTALICRGAGSIQCLKPLKLFNRHDHVAFQTTFTDTNADFGAVDGLTDNFLNPDTAQFLQSLIVSNTQTDIVVWADFSELGDNNEDYKVYDYRLDSSSASPCIDAADNEVPGLAGVIIDLDNTPRFVQDLASPDTGNGDLPLVDMGAYEFAGCPIIADINCDDVVNELDLALMALYWLATI